MRQNPDLTFEPGEFGREVRFDIQPGEKRLFVLMKKPVQLKRAEWARIYWLAWTAFLEIRYGPPEVSQLMP
jgi:hypothetical protein